jgi:hypothetical protein
MLACSAASICHLETLGLRPIWSNSAAMQTTTGRLLTSLASAWGITRLIILHPLVSLYFVLSDCYETESLLDLSQCAVYMRREILFSLSNQDGLNLTRFLTLFSLKTCCPEKDCCSTNRIRLY